MFDKQTISKRKYIIKTYPHLLQQYNSLCESCKSPFLSKYADTGFKCPLLPVTTNGERCPYYQKGD